MTDRHFVIFWQLNKSRRVPISWWVSLWCLWLYRFNWVDIDSCSEIDRMALLLWFRTDRSIELRSFAQLGPVSSLIFRCTILSIIDASLPIWRTIIAKPMWDTGGEIADQSCLDDDDRMTFLGLIDSRAGSLSLALRGFGRFLVCTAKFSLVCCCSIVVLEIWKSSEAFCLRHSLLTFRAAAVSLSLLRLDNVFNEADRKMLQVCLLTWYCEAYCGGCREGRERGRSAQSFEANLMEYIITGSVPHAVAFSKFVYWFCHVRSHSCRWRTVSRADTRSILLYRLVRLDQPGVSICMCWIFNMHANR